MVSELSGVTDKSALANRTDNAPVCSGSILVLSLNPADPKGATIALMLYVVSGFDLNTPELALYTVGVFAVYVIVSAISPVANIAPETADAIAALRLI